MNKRQARRLLNVARSLRESANPELFSMHSYVNDVDTLLNKLPVGDSGVDTNLCGTPACALGHYASRTDLQRKMRIAQLGKEWFTGVPLYGLRYNNNRAVGFDDRTILDHFGITRDETYELFDGYGCGGAKTAIEAAQYIEDFVQNRYPG